MGVIADFGSYPDWATGVRSAEVLAAGPDGRPLQVRFGLDAGIVRDSYVLAYEWDGDTGVRWELAEAGTETELTLYPGADHMWAGAPGAGPQALRQTIGALRRWLLGQDPDGIAK